MKISRKMEHALELKLMRISFRVDHENPVFEILKWPKIKRKVVKKLNLNNIRIKYLTNILQDDDLETLLVLFKAILWTESNPDKYSEERAENWKALRARSLENQAVLKKTNGKTH